jgi:uncharacterized protein YkwD
VQTSTSSASGASTFRDALNALRRQNGLRGLREDADLARAAQAHAEDMAQHGYFSHTSRDGSTLFHRVRGADCQRAKAFAENIGHGQRSTQEIFEGWAESPGHRVNMLGRQYRSFGLGQASGYWVLVVADGC